MTHQENIQTIGLQQAFQTICPGQRFSNDLSQTLFFKKFVLDGILGALGALLGLDWALLGPSEAVLGRSWGALEALLERSWGALGALLGALGTLLGALGTLLGVSWAQLGKIEKGIRFFATNLALKTEPSWGQNTPQTDAQKRYDFRDVFSSFLKGLPSNLCSQNRSSFGVKCRDPLT